MIESVFILCALMSLFCTAALMRGYQKSRNPLLLWCALCFLFLALDHAFVCVDLLAFPQTDFQGPFWRNLLTAIAGLLLLSGLIQEIS